MSKEKKESFLIARIPKTLKRKVQEETKKQKTSISEYIRSLVEKDLK